MDEDKLKIIECAEKYGWKLTNLADFQTEDDEAIFDNIQLTFRRSSIE